ncbi:Copia type Polyprotein [Phytophthora megakarya]|uniref:Copia type Polyprotein n=1 Tax=Phytophthora megakarya TaxID=4795 RepID=A0A225UIS8_9STRA|nr:Copia type Polyprotein [Phytophthora megakarya]
MLTYLATSTRPDLAFVLGQLSRFVANPSAKHVGALKRVLRYLAGTLDYSITYTKQKGKKDAVVLEGFSDSDWANDPEQRKSSTGFVFTLAGGTVAWMSRRQSIVALSTAEAECVATCEAMMEAVAGRHLLQEIFPGREVKLRIGIDNQAAHTMATNLTYSRRTRPI